MQKNNNNNNNNNNKGANPGNKGANAGNKGANASNNGSKGGDNGPKDENNEKEKIKKIKKKIQRLLNKEGNVDLALFYQKVKGRKMFKEKSGNMIDKDMARHAGKVWKLLDREGNRICSLDSKGKMVSG